KTCKVPVANMALVSMETSITNAGSTEEAEAIAGVGIEQNSAESRALVPVLPEEWPLPHQQRRRYYNNMEFTSVTHTSVNKAQAHMELLQNAIEDWMAQQTPSQISQPALRSGKSLGTAKSTATSAKSAPATAAGKAASSLGDASAKQAPLEVVGVGQQQPQPNFVYYEDDPGVPYLGAEEVVQEVMQLMVKLENDRLQAEEDIRLERGKVIELASRIDRLSEAKLLQMPVAVQAEHEACIEDIAELNWHVQSKRKNLDKSRRRHAKSVRMNEEIKEEMAYIRVHDPLVREKLQLELSKIDTIKEEGSDTRKEMQDTKKKLDRVEKKNKDAHGVANQERARMKGEVDKATDNLQKARDAVQKSEEQFVELCERIVNSKEKNRSNKQEIEELRVKNAAAYKQQNELQATVDELTKTLRYEEHQTRLLDEELYQTQDNHEKLKANQDAQKAEMQAAVDHSEDRYIFLRREADEHATELQDMQDRLKDCERQKVDDEKNLARMEAELERTQEEMERILEEFGKVAQEHSNVAKKLESEEKKVMFVEDSLKATITQLQKQVEDEIATRERLIVRIETDTRDLGKSKVEAKVKKAKLKKMSEKMEVLVSQMRQKVAKLRAESAEKCAVADALQRELDDLLEERRQTEARLDGRIGELRPKHEAEKAEVDRLVARLAEIGEQIEMMNKKIRDIYDQTGMIKRTQMKFTDAIRMLEDQMQQLTHELSKSTRSDDSLKAQLAAVQARMASRADEHRRLQENRRETQRQLESEYRAALEENRRLAGDYRARQNEVFRMKEDLLDLLNEILRREEAVRDLKQGKRLQEKTHFALKTYLRYKQQLTELQMDDMQSRGRENLHKTQILDSEIHRNLDGITSFLTSQMDVLMRGQRVQQDLPEGAAATAE
ncbi:hypothetical protein BOX15_Mlig015820g2, partial [Macrostomum lignano]